jgi:hypothetical protein
VTQRWVHGNKAGKARKWSLEDQLRQLAGSTEREVNDVLHDPEEKIGRRVAAQLFMDALRAESAEDRRRAYEVITNRVFGPPAPAGRLLPDDADTMATIQTYLQMRIASGAAQQAVVASRIIESQEAVEVDD